MGEHHHWVLIDGYTNAYSCCDCGATRGDKTVLAEVRPVHTRRLFATERLLARRTRVGARHAG